MERDNLGPTCDASTADAAQPKPLQTSQERMGCTPLSPSLHESQQRTICSCGKMVELRLLRLLALEAAADLKQIQRVTWMSDVP